MTRLTNTLVNDVAGLLSRGRFSASVGLSVETDRVAVHVSPRRDADGATFSAILMCRAFGHFSVDWTKVQVSIKTEDGSLVDPQPLTPQGRVVFRGLLVDSRYEMVAVGGRPVAVDEPTTSGSGIAKQQPHSVRFPNQGTGQLLGTWIPGVLAAAGEKGGGGEWEAVSTQTIAETDIHCTLWRAPNGRSFISCETSKPEWAQESIRIEVAGEPLSSSRPLVLLASLVFMREGKSWRTKQQPLPPHLDGDLRVSLGGRDESCPGAAGDEPASDDN